MRNVVEVRNLPRSVPKEWLPRLKAALYREFRFIHPISLAFVDERTMQRLNRTWRGVNRSTDVLSFKFSDRPSQRVCQGPTMVPEELGEVIVCVPVVRRQAREIERSFHDELTAVALHGILHLLGFNHTVSRDRRRMEAMGRKLGLLMRRRRGSSR